MGLRSGQNEDVTFQAPLIPDTPFYVIGDVHGCDQLLADLLDRISDDALDTTAPIICVGDYIDRGEDSAAVLRRLHRISTAQDSTLICLKGNHEEMMLDFLDDPERHADLWLRNGGMQTLASFQINGVRQSMSGRQLRTACAQLEAALGPELITWLRSLPNMWSTGNVTVVHAGADPNRRIDQQSHEVLTWGHADFFKAPRVDGQWIVYGHTIVPQVVCTNGRIGVDTGAFATGRLSAASISATGISVLTASLDR